MLFTQFTVVIYKLLVSDLGKFFSQCLFTRDKTSHIISAPVVDFRLLIVVYLSQNIIHDLRIKIRYTYIFKQFL